MAAAAVICFATRRARSSSPRENSRLSSSRPPHEETVAVDGTDGSDSDDDSEETTTSEDERSNAEDTTSDYDSDVEKKTSDGGSSSQETSWGNRPPKETIAFDDGCDFKHWVVIIDPPPGNARCPDISRDELIDSYIKTLAQVVGSEEKARKNIYSVSTRHYFAFGAYMPEELSSKLKELPKVQWVIPGSYLDAKNKDYGGEPFINGKAVPYDPKYHEEWLKNNYRDNCSVRRDNMGNFQNRDVPTGRPRSKVPSPQCQQTMEPHDVPPVHHAQDNMPSPPSSPINSDPPTYQHHVQSPQACDTPSFEQNFKHCGAPVHKVGNQELQYSPDARMCDDNNNGCQRGRLGYQNDSAAGQTALHGANAPPRQSGSEPGYQGQEVHHHHYCSVHYHYNY